MQTRTLEIGVGLFLLAGLLALLLLALRVSGLSVGNAGDTYKVYAYFDNIAGVTVRGKVTLAGVTIGKVTAVDLDRDSYTGRVTMEINQNVNNLPVDSTASILTAGLLGEKYIGISVGGDEDVLKDGSTIHDTQSALVLEDLIGKFLLNSVNKDEAKSEVFFHADSSASRPAGVPGGFPAAFHGGADPATGGAGHGRRAAFRHQGQQGRLQGRSAKALRHSRPYPRAGGRCRGHRQERDDRQVFAPGLT